MVDTAKTNADDENHGQSQRCSQIGHARLVIERHFPAPDTLDDDAIDLPADRIETIENPVHPDGDTGL